VYIYSLRDAMMAGSGSEVGIFGAVDLGGGSNHVDEALQNVVVGPQITSYSGKRNVVIGTSAASGSIRSTDNFVGGWAAGGSAGSSNVIIGSRAGQYVDSSTIYSVIVGPLAAFSASTVINSMVAGPRVVGTSTSVVNSTIIGTDVDAGASLSNVTVVADDTKLGDDATPVVRNIVGHVSGSWLSGSEITAFGQGIVTEGGNSDVVILGDNVAAGSGRTILVGRDLATGSGGTGNVLLGAGTRVLNANSNVLALGAGAIDIDRSDVEYIGTGIVYDRVANSIEMLKGAVTLGGDSSNLGEGILVVDKGVGMTTTRSHNYDATFECGLTLKYGLESWTLKMEPGEHDQYDLVFESDRGTRVSFHDDYEAGVTNFTGQHRCQIVDADVQRARVGQVVCCTGEHASLDGRDVDVDEAVPVVELSTTKKDARAFGVISCLEDAGPTRSVSIGFMRFTLPKPVPERRVRVNGSGEGGILVCSESGDIANGDLLCTSSTPGLAMKQLGCFVTNFTCAKATASVRFEGHHAAGVLVGCVYKF
jgi:hypothetical protein